MIPSSNVHASFILQLAFLLALVECLEVQVRAIIAVVGVQRQCQSTGRALEWSFYPKEYSLFRIPVRLCLLPVGTIVLVVSRWRTGSGKSGAPDLDDQREDLGRSTPDGR